MVCLWVLAVIGLILDVLCFKWLSLANLLFYLELLFSVIAAFIPSSQGVAQSQQIIILLLASSIGLFCNALPNLIYLAIVLAWLTFGQLPLVYGVELLDGEYVFESLEIVFVVLVIFTGVTMLMMDGGRAKQQLEVLRIDDFNLLNNMQEGLFVLNKE